LAFREAPEGRLSRAEPPAARPEGEGVGIHRSVDAGARLLRAGLPNFHYRGRRGSDGAAALRGAGEPR